MGQCAYTLVETVNFTIEAENTPCDGAVSQVTILLFNCEGVMYWTHY